MTAYARVLDAMGAAIVGGELRPGDVETVERIERRTGASRSVVREAVRVLVNLGLMRASRRVGLTVQDREHWNVLDPQLVRWRMAGNDRRDQLRELRDLRRAIEPEAAKLAATRRNNRDADELVTAARRLESAGNPELFLEVDAQLHHTLLRASGNSMFVRLQEVVSEALRQRALGPPPIVEPSVHDIALHLRVAQAVADADPYTAAAAMREIIERTGDADPDTS